MSYSTIYEQGSVISVTIPATESIAVKSLGGTVRVYKIVGYPNLPDKRVLVGTITDGTPTVYGAYSAGATIEIDASEGGALYAVGVAPTVSDDGKYQYQGTPGVLDATGALTAAMILSGIVTSAAATVAGTVPTGTVMEAASEFAIGDSVDFSIIKVGANAFTVTAATGITIVGDAVVATATTGLFRIRKTAAVTFVIYRMG